MYEVFYKGTMIAQFQSMSDAVQYYMQKINEGYESINFHVEHTLN